MVWATDDVLERMVRRNADRLRLVRVGGSVGVWQLHTLWDGRWRHHRGAVDVMLVESEAEWLTHCQGFGAVGSKTYAEAIDSYDRIRSAKGRQRVLQSLEWLAAFYEAHPEHAPGGLVIQRKDGW